MDMLTQEWFSFIGLFSGAVLVIFWLLKHQTKLEEILKVRDEQLEKEHQYVRDLVDRMHEASLRRIEMDNSTRITFEKVLESLS